MHDVAKSMLKLRENNQEKANTKAVCNPINGQNAIYTPKQTANVNFCEERSCPINDLINVTTFFFIL
jgi:hypothetical protein